MATGDSISTTKGHIKKNQRFKSYEDDTKIDKLTHIINIDLPKFNLDIQGQFKYSIKKHNLYYRNMSYTKICT